MYEFIRTKFTAGCRFRTVYPYESLRGLICCWLSLACEPLWFHVYEQIRICIFCAFVLTFIVGVYISAAPWSHDLPPVSVLDYRMDNNLILLITLNVFEDEDERFLKVSKDGCTHCT